MRVRNFCKHSDSKPCPLQMDTARTARSASLSPVGYAHTSSVTRQNWLKRGLVQLAMQNDPSCPRTCPGSNAITSTATKPNLPSAALLSTSFEPSLAMALSLQPEGQDRTPPRP
eukprot:CAMPEP_0169434002 /NCGR_PEP_ID=MMETSP1042-20121227/4297_1 /TAXON_ID=464988 /ORGANISM="Hemiselmis andersenii, Strain CCMP1180" /LENGTH=113 /DNA_ID=CAMNT_0009544549 /DNA_START=356 /DNA_END=695 /DNA_ORIENTATION=+